MEENEMTPLAEAFKSLFEVNMGITAGERIVVFSDCIRPDETPSPADADRRTRLLDIAKEATEFAGKAYGNTRFVSFPATAASGAEPPEELWRAVMGDEIVGRLAAEGLLSRLLAKQASPREL